MTKKLEELLDKEEELSREIIEYKEVDDNRTAGKLERKLSRIRDLIKVENENEDIKIVKKLNIYEKFMR